MAFHCSAGTWCASSVTTHPADFRNDFIPFESTLRILEEIVWIIATAISPFFRGSRDIFLFEEDIILTFFAPILSIVATHWSNISLVWVRTIVASPDISIAQVAVVVLPAPQGIWTMPCTLFIILSIHSIWYGLREIFRSSIVGIDSALLDFTFEIHLTFLQFSDSTLFMPRTLPLGNDIWYCLSSFDILTLTIKLTFFYLFNDLIIICYSL